PMPASNGSCRSRNRPGREGGGEPASLFSAGLATAVAAFDLSPKQKEATAAKRPEAAIMSSGPACSSPKMRSGQPTPAPIRSQEYSSPTSRKRVRNRETVAPEKKKGTE